MNALHIVLLILALLLAAGATGCGFSAQPINRYAVPLLCAAVTVWFLDLLLIGLRVYTG